MANKYFFDESSQTRMRVVSFDHTWEQLSPEVRVRRRQVGPVRTLHLEGMSHWTSVFGEEFEDLRREIE